MMILNGQNIDSLESLEIAMTEYSLSEDQKVLLRNDFNGILNPAAVSIKPVTNQQLRTALVLTSFYQNKPNIHPDAIKAFIDTLPEPNRSLATQQWEYSNEMNRDNALVNSMAAMLGLSSADLDGIWIYAKTL